MREQVSRERRAFLRLLLGQKLHFMAREKELDAFRGFHRYILLFQHKYAEFS